MVRRSALALASVLALPIICAAATACDETPDDIALGSMDITTSAPAAARPELTTADGWVLKFERVLVHVTAVNVAGDDKVLAASATPQIIDQVAVGTKSLLTATVRTARTWEDVNFEIGPALPGTDTTFAEPVTEADRTMMETDGLSLYVEGKLTKESLTKTFKWGLKADTLYTACEENRNGVVVRGLVVPANGNDTADIVMDPTVLFAEDLGGSGPLSAEPMTLADGDNDGTITMAELRAAPLGAKRVETAAAAGVAAADLGAFVEALAPKIVKAFRAAGTCAAAPVAPAP